MAGPTRPMNPASAAALVEGTGLATIAVERDLLVAGVQALGALTDAIRRAVARDEDPAHLFRVGDDE